MLAIVRTCGNSYLYSPSKEIFKKPDTGLCDLGKSFYPSIYLFSHMRNGNNNEVTHIKHQINRGIS